MLFFGGREATTGNASAVCWLKTCIPVVKFLSENILTPETYSTVHTCEEIILNFAKTF